MEGRTKTKVQPLTDDLAIGDWQVERCLVTGRVEGRGPMAVANECGGHCCRHGVYISLPERDLILRHAGRVRDAMDETQSRDIADWFEDDVHEDDDFEGGVCIGTAVYNDKCAFLDADGLCVLQKLEPDLDLPQGERLKPFYCRLFPISTWYGRLEFDDLCDGARPCCTMAADGATRAVDAYAYELGEVLGLEGLEEARRLADELRDEEEARRTGAG